VRIVGYRDVLGDDDNNGVDDGVDDGLGDADTYGAEIGAAPQIQIVLMNPTQPTFHQD